MQVHYVDDNPADGALLSHSLKSEVGLQVQTARTLDQLAAALVDGQADCILLDVRRPDSVSMADDVRRVRELTNAPVVFISGDVADETRQQGLQAGAYAVLEKTAMRSPILKQILTNARAVAQTHATDFEADVELIYEKVGPFALPNWNLARFNGVFQQVQTLMADLSRNADRVPSDRLEFFESMMDDLRTFSATDLTTVSYVSVAGVIGSVLTKLETAGLEQDIRVSVLTEWSDAPIAGNEILFRLGLTRVLETILTLCRPGDHLLVSRSDEDGGGRIYVQTKGIILPDTDILFTGAQPSSTHPGAEAICSLQLGLAMLNVGRSEFRSVISGRSQEISFLL